MKDVDLLEYYYAERVWQKHIAATGRKSGYSRRILVGSFLATAAAAPSGGRGTRKEGWLFGPLIAQARASRQRKEEP